MPFHTHWVGSSYNHTSPELLYILDLALWTISLQIMDINILVDNPEVSRDSTGHKHLLAMIFYWFYYSSNRCNDTPIININCDAGIYSFRSDLDDVK